MLLRIQETRPISPEGTNISMRARRRDLSGLSPAVVDLQHFKPILDRF